jgi:hypothetical protein
VDVTHLGGARRRHRPAAAAGGRPNRYRRRDGATTPLFDLPLPDLEQYLQDREEPEDFDSFWARTLNEAGSVPLDPQMVAHDAGL